MTEQAPSFDEVLRSGEYKTYTDAVLAHAEIIGTIPVQRALESSTENKQLKKGSGE